MMTSSIYFRATLASIFAAAITAEECPCPTDKTLRIGGVSHGNVADSFWDPIYAAAERAAMDSGVDLDFARYVSSTQTDQGGQDTLNWMVDRIEKLCTGDNAVDGLFSTIQDAAILTALKTNCLANGIPTAVINAGYNLVQEPQEDSTFLHFIGADDYNTGKESGERLVDECPTCKRFYCLDHCGNCTGWFERCRGFGDAVGEAYGQTIPIDDDSSEAYIASVESVIGTNSTWDDVGLLLGAQQSLVFFAEALREKHNGVKMAGIDTSPGLYEVLDNPDWLWGTSQEAYLQGYYPVQMLTNTIRMGGQSLQTFNLETGPAFVTEARDLCYSDPFQGCVADDTQNPPTSETVPPTALDEPSPGARKLASVTTRLVSAALRLFGI